MADRFSVISIPAHLTTYEDGSMIHVCQTTRSTEAEALRAVETPNWQQQATQRDYRDSVGRINHSKELYCYGCGYFHEDAAFGYDKYEKERRFKNRHCKAWRSKRRLFDTGREDLLAVEIRQRIIKTSRKQRYGRE